MSCDHGSYPPGECLGCDGPALRVELAGVRAARDSALADVWRLINERDKARAETRREVLEEVREWLDANGYAAPSAPNGQPSCRMTSADLLDALSKDNSNG